ncbi:AAA family ATPase [Amphritea japonica]|uniref:Phage related protein n=1 Tax=Amphritea japonica ATCC BAA-1530 TaxID=1278309 RepID=A0A7R6SRN0_9GAMM|nr:AAA family ATPase [Amphritea japonica]BBB24617.1 phage related protein [Amphritea japonica ATCC BAA-1530]
MKIIYTPNLPWGAEPPAISGEKDYLSLSGNNWDDFGYRTTLNARIFFDGEAIDLDFSIKMLIDDVEYTREHLNNLCKEGWNGRFPIPDQKYVSVPTDIDFYKTIHSRLSSEEMSKFLALLGDAGYLVEVKKDKSSTRLTQLDIFNTSLLRGSGSNKCFQDGWRILEHQDSSIRDFKFRLNTQSGGVCDIPFSFESDLLPYDINVLIGPNGIGKSYCLRSLVEYWLQIDKGAPDQLSELGYDPFDHRPNISRLILVSYSPFEEFSLGLKKKDKVLDTSAYRYFGFRKKLKNGRIGISRGLPKLNASESLLDAIYEDHKYQEESWWINKFDTCLKVLKKAVGFDEIYLKLDSNQNLSALKKYIKDIKGSSYLILDSSLPAIVFKQELIDCCDMQSGAYFIKNKKLCDLSSGQLLFSYIVINVIGSIRENSLVVIDEPELFLHPTLEIEFLSLLKSVLKPFKSKAILATHSLSVVREVPSNCVHIFREGKDGFDVIPPPFETFGGSVQRISAYVFGDRSVSKPFDEWLEKQMAGGKQADTLIDQLGEEINEELMMRIHRISRRLNGS